MFDNRFVNWLLDRYGYPLAGAVVRTVRILLWVAATAVVTWALENVTDLNLAVEYEALVVAILVGLDKYVREKKAESEG